jgi:2-desacetyl-2-hydroxyethyl bacteriochlorophyllide A dehydrogenase
MNTLTLTSPGLFEFRTDAPEPARPGPNEALVAIRRVGICGTDIGAYRGKQPFFSYPRVLGHELGVEVLAVGADVTHVKSGDRCSVEPYLNCGHCIACRRGKSNCCESLRVLGVHIDGGMCERFTLPAHKLHPANDLSFEQLALVETLGIGAHAVSRGAPRDDETALVLGAGPIGLSAIQFARMAAREVIVIDANPARLAFAQEMFGLAHAITAGPDALAQIRALTDGSLPELVIDATGNASSMRSAFDYVAHGGRLVFVGLVQDDIPVSDPHLHRREITLLASRNALPADFTRIIRLIRDGQVDTRPWITHTAALADVPAAFPGWLAPDAGTVKAMVSI